MTRPAIIRTLTAMAGLHLVACARPPHVKLEAPPVDGTLEVRQAAFEELRPRSEFELESGIKGGVPASVLRTSDRLQLAGGAEVYYAEDLKPVLPANSRAYREADRESSHTTTAGILDVAGVVLLAVGTAVAISPFLTTSGDDSVDTKPIYIGTGVAVLSIPVFLFSGAQRRDARDAKANVFESYESALRQRLALCPVGGEVGACPKAR
jgi:hypothetical protein